MKLNKIIIVILFISLFLTGCTNSYYSEDQEEKVVQAGQPLITEYLDKNYSEYTLINCHMLNGSEIDGYIYAGYYLSNFVEGKFKVNDVIHTVVVDITTGDLYSDEQNEAFEAYLKEQIKPYIDNSGYEGEFVIDNAQLEYKLISKDVTNSKKVMGIEVSVYILDTEVLVYGLLPIKYNIDNFDELISSSNTEGSFFELTVLFHNDEVGSLPNDALKQFSLENPFFKEGSFKVFNLTESDFNDILSGNKKYHYTMEKLEDYTILLSND